ncbi:MAG: hypothetical protein BGP14_00590 [Sphingobacteriales bacterium 44-15]|nr:MAG: hypothetical protein BGP14_00590 [Sphingobacteriales bacterium 44-15]
MAMLAAIRLIKSLSGSEKRVFKLYVKRQSTERSYLFLFDLIDSSNPNSLQTIETTFKKKYPSASIYNTSRYLVKIITDCLIQLKADKDQTFQLYLGLMRSRILKERSLYEESYNEIKRTRLKAHTYQYPIVEYLTYREELNYLSDNNFHETTDKRLVEIQMKAKMLLRDVNHIHDHHSLFELLKYRLIHAGKISSKEQLSKLNDLVLSEMALVTNKPANSFAAQKLHLLFQSFFFTNVGEYTSALKIFSSLNQLFEKKLELLDNPPFDYLSALNGILDSLHTLAHFDKMNFYIEKLHQLHQSIYPEYFRSLVQKISVLYQLISLNSKMELSESVALIDSLGRDWINQYSMIDEEKQWELYFNIAKSYFLLKDFRKSHHWINNAMLRQHCHKNWLICKATRLLNIILYYERGERDYLEYEITAYKRFFGKEHLLKSEIILLKNIKFKIRTSVPGKAKLQQAQNDLNVLRKDQYEIQLLKHFDFLAWNP